MDFILTCKKLIWIQFDSKRGETFVLQKKNLVSPEGGNLLLRGTVYLSFYNLIDKNIYLRSNNISTFLIARCLNLTHFWSSTELLAA